VTPAAVNVTDSPPAAVWDLSALTVNGESAWLALPAPLPLDPAGALGAAGESDPAGALGAPGEPDASGEEGAVGTAATSVPEEPPPPPQPIRIRESSAIAAFLAVQAILCIRQKLPGIVVFFHAILTGAASAPFEEKQGTRELPAIGGGLWNGRDGIAAQTGAAQARQDVEKHGERAESVNGKREWKA